MSFRGVWHFSFHVADLDRSVQFYTEVLGLELVHRQEQDNAYTRRLVGYDNARLRVAQLSVPGQPRGQSSHDLELVEYVQPRGEAFKASDRHRPGASHLAFVVEDAWQTYTRLSQGGVAFISEPQEILEGVNKGGFTCYFLDPDEITLELVQPPIRV